MRESTYGPIGLAPSRATTPVRVRLLLFSLQFLFFFVPPAVGLHAQALGDVEGYVVEDSTRVPVADASVELRGTDGLRLLAGRYQAATDRDGRFRISGVPEGIYLVRVEHLNFGVHDHPLEVEGRGTASMRIEVSAAAVTLAPVVVDAQAARDRESLGTPSSRNTIPRERIAEAASSGLALGSLLRRDVPGMNVRQVFGGVSGDLCVEFRGARRGDGACRPPQVFIDGVTVPDPLSIFGAFAVSGLEEVRFLPPAEAGSRFGPNAAWGVILLETRRTRLNPDAAIPVLRRRELSAVAYDWELESDEHSSGRVFAAAFIGNAIGLAAGGALLSQCMDLSSRRIYRAEDYCGAGPVLGSALLAAALPTLAGSLSARWAGGTEWSQGRLGRSIFFALPVYVPGYALVSLSDGRGGISALDVAGLALVAVGAPLLNTIADRLFRDSAGGREEAVR